MRLFLFLIPFGLSKYGIHPLISITHRLQNPEVEEKILHSLEVIFNTYERFSTKINIGIW
jgi:hypothetical protein